MGGVVRDRLLRRPLARDVDVAVEGNAVDIARRAAAGRSARAGVLLRVHERFDTATLAIGGWRVDLAGTRRESYRRPGALPDVAPAALEEDLRRRDFTVNAMALVLPRPGRRAAFLDPFAGREDLAGRRLRVLHSGSFRDDPTRGFRAARYANRLRFRIEPSSRRLLTEALDDGAFDGVSGDRLRRELEKIFDEGGWASAVRLLVSLGISRALHPSLDGSGATLRALDRAERLAEGTAGQTTSRMPLFVWSAPLAPSEAAALATRLALGGSAREALARWPDTRRVLMSGEAASAKISRDERFAAAALVAGRSATLRRRLLSGPPQLSIRGADLLQAGIPPGPRVGRALERTREARAQGRIEPREELAFALDAARGEENL